MRWDFWCSGSDTQDAKGRIVIITVYYNDKISLGNVVLNIIQNNIIKTYKKSGLKSSLP